MAQEKFIYKASPVDQLITLIVVLAVLAFIGLVYFDRSTASETTGSNPEIQNLIEEKNRLEAELQRLEEENKEEEA